jgi:hypothetical protein
MSDDKAEKHNPRLNERSDAAMAQSDKKTMRKRRRIRRKRLRHLKPTRKAWKVS